MFLWALFLANTGKASCTTGVHIKHPSGAIEFGAPSDAKLFRKATGTLGIEGKLDAKERKRQARRRGGVGAADRRRANGE